jgi:hypothetical protein
MNYEVGLKCDNKSVVKSSVINVMKLYYLYPNLDYSYILPQLSQLSEKGQTDEIRFIAELVKQYLENKTDLAWMMEYTSEEIHNYFTVISTSEIRKTAYGF